MSFEVTHACNADCRHCHRGGPVQEQLASPARLAEIFRELRPPVIQISGGEPLMRDDLLEVIRALKQPDGTPYIILVTNGSLLTPEGVRQTRAAGVDAYSVSLDYPDERHDEFRMIPGLFNHLKELVARVTPEERALITLNCVVQSDNFRDILPLAELAREWGACMNFSPYTWLRTDDREYLISGDDLQELRGIFRELLAFQRDHDTVKTNETVLNNMIHFFENGGIGSCRAGERFLNVNPDGTFSPCGLFTTDFATREGLLEEFSRSNTCNHCNTSIRAWTERPFSTFFSSIRPQVARE